MPFGWSGGCHLYIDGTKCSAIGEEVAPFELSVRSLGRFLMRESIASV
jgi:hypothetical protein